MSEIIHLQFGDGDSKKTCCGKEVSTELLTRMSNVTTCEECYVVGLVVTQINIPRGSAHRELMNKIQAIIADIYDHPQLENYDNNRDCWNGALLKASLAITNWLSYSDLLVRRKWE